VGQWIIKVQKKKKKISSIPLAHGISLSAHEICITLGTMDTTSSCKDFQLLISTNVNTFNLRACCECRTLTRPSHSCDAAAHLPQALAKSYVQEERRILPPKTMLPVSYYFHVRISAYMVTLFGISLP